MQPNISPANLIFILAYAFDLKWDYLEKEVSQQDLKHLSFFELLVFVLLKWTEQLVKHGLYRAFLNTEEETKRIRGRILFAPSIKTCGFYSDALFCQFDDLSFDILENKILLSTLHFCERELNSEIKGLTKKRRESREELDKSVLNLVRLLSSQISYQPLSIQLFNQILFHRMNIQYKPILQVCRFLFDSAVLYQSGQERFFDIPEGKMSEIFERFLRNFLAEQLAKDGFEVDYRGFRDWVVTDGDKKAVHMPGIQPDIIVWRNRVPKFVIDAKFYKNPVYKVEPRYSYEPANEENVHYKTHSHNLYQMIAYTDYLNCNGLLVYAQTESGFFEEYVKISPKYYLDKESHNRWFGFRTLDLSGEFEDFKERTINFTEQIKSAATGN